jgi:hypothetical protein
MGTDIISQQFSCLKLNIQEVETDYCMIYKIKIETRPVNNREFPFLSLSSFPLAYVITERRGGLKHILKGFGKGDLSRFREHMLDFVREISFERVRFWMAG